MYWPQLQMDILYQTLLDISAQVLLFLQILFSLKETDNIKMPNNLIFAKILPYTNRYQQRWYIRMLISLYYNSK